MTEDVMNANFLVYRKKLEQAVNVDLTSLFEDYGESIKVSPFSSVEDSGTAYDGGFVEYVLKKFTKTAVKLNELLPQDLICDKNSLVKVCLLQHLPKVKLFVKTKEDWKIKKGVLYDVVQQPTVLRNGENTIMLCMKYGIPLTNEEAEAILSIDRVDDQSKYYSTLLTMIVRQANEMASYVCRNQFKLNATKK